MTDYDTQINILNKEASTLHEEIEKHLQEIEIIENLMVSASLIYKGDLSEEKAHHNRQIDKLREDKSDIYKKLTKLTNEKRKKEALQLV